MPKSASVYLAQDQFNELVESKGLNAIWEQAVMCSCIDDDTKNPDYNCQYCRGTGIMYMKGKEIKALVSSLQGTADIYKEFGIVASGTCYVTTKSYDILGWRDRLTFTGIRSKFSEVLRWEGTESSKTVKQVRNPIAIVYKGQYYLPNVFKFTDGRVHGVPFVITEGEKLSILYYTYPSYVVSNMVHELRASITKTKRVTPEETEFPKQAMCTRVDFEYNTKIVDRGADLDECDEDTCNLLGG